VDEGSARVVNVERCEVCELTHISEISSTTKSDYKISAIVTHAQYIPTKTSKQSAEYYRSMFKALI
jgi:hypothetical protein